MGTSKIQRTDVSVDYSVFGVRTLFGAPLHTQDVLTELLARRATHSRTFGKLGLGAITRGTYGRVAFISTAAAVCLVVLGIGTAAAAASPTIATAERNGRRLGSWVPIYIEKIRGKLALKSPTIVKGNRLDLVYLGP